jgi:L-lactate dehydrogenase complex protein LldG
MNSRERILAAVASNEPTVRPLPILPYSVPTPALADAFAERLTSIGGEVVHIATLRELPQTLRTRFGSSARTVHSILGLTMGEYLPTTNTTLNGRQLEDVTVAVLQGAFGVAENGAVWLTDQAMPHRALPFICQHLVLVLAPGALVGTLHEAYQRLTPHFAYGVFIAGPSKTADIEQSLVIGAHGARSLTVVLPNSPYLLEPTT